MGLVMDENITNHLIAIDTWLASHRPSVRPSQGLSNNERKQLQAVEKSIQQLSALGVPIPDELRRLKLQLSAKDVVRPTTERTHANMSEVAEIVSTLNRLTQAAKALHNQLKAPDEASNSKQRYDVTLKMLIQQGHLSPDDLLEFSWQKGGPVFEGKVRTDGMLMAKTSLGWTAFESLSAAATSIGQCSLNGWLHWRRVNADGSHTTLKDVRTTFLNEIGDKVISDKPIGR